MAKAKYTKDSKGYFQTKVWDGTYVNGKKHRITLRSSKSSKDLEQKVIEHNQKIQERNFVRKSNVTFYDYAVSWKKAYKGHLEHNTQAMYSNIIEKHFNDILCPITEINRGLYVASLNGITGTRTMQQFQMVFKQVVKSAIKDKLLPESAYSEMFDDTVKVKYSAPEKRALKQSEKDAIKKCTFKNERDNVFLNLLYYTGMRGEEIRALTVFDINISKKEISISKAVVFDKNDPVEKDTKNGVHRVIPISDALVSVLEPYMKGLNGTRLFSMPDGKYMTKTAYRRMWERVLQEIRRNCNEPVNDLTPHLFRHNYCAALCNMIPQISIQKIAELLGDSERMVVEVYNHEVAGKEKPHSIVAEALAL